MIRKIVLCTVILLCTLVARAQFTSLREGWIAVAGASAEGYGVYYFRKTVNIGGQPQASCTYRVHVSGNSRYKLFVNGKKQTHQ